MAASADDAEARRRPGTVGADRRHVRALRPRGADDEPGEYGHRHMGPRAMHGFSSFRLGIPLPDIGPGPVLTACRLHGCDRPLGNDRAHHFVHCGRLIPHGMHTALENALRTWRRTSRAW
jgi:hypothetical protein